VGDGEEELDDGEEELGDGEEELGDDNEEEGVLDGAEQGDDAIDEDGTGQRTVEGTLTERDEAQSDRKRFTRWPKPKRCDISCTRST
jgi:hypothetical protein